MFDKKMSIFKWLLVILVVLIHVLIILGCIFGDKLYQETFYDHATAKLNLSTKEKRDAPDNYFCVEEKIFPYAMAFMIVFLTIFLLGLAKGLIGLICSRRIGMFGLDLLLDLPHPINSYYEPELRCEEVIYDEQGWPIHPVTCQRVRIINESSELCINSVFFFAFPFFVIWVAIQNAFHCYENVNIECTTDPCFGKKKKYHAPLPPKVVPCENYQDQNYYCVHKAGGGCKKLDTYNDEDDTTEEKDTMYVLDQLSKSEDKLNIYKKGKKQKLNFLH